MKKLSLKKYKDKYVSLKEIYRTIRKSLIFNNKSGNVSGYSQYKYNFNKATKDGIIYPSMDPSIFELKYPNRDINGRVTTY